MPGVTSCRWCCSSLYSGKYCTNNGRGPMNAMSPFNILINCGNSSIDVERMNLPTLVNRLASGSRLPSTSRSSVIVLNFNALKIFSFLPGRSCAKNTPFHPFLLTKKSKIATQINSGENKINAINAPKKPIGLFTIYIYIFCPVDNIKNYIMFTYLLL